MLESLETSSYSKVISLIIRRNIVVPPAAASQHPAQGYLWDLQMLSLYSSFMSGYYWMDLVIGSCEGNLTW